MTHSQTRRPYVSAATTSTLPLRNTAPVSRSRSRNVPRPLRFDGLLLVEAPAVAVSPLVRLGPIRLPRDFRLFLLRIPVDPPAPAAARIDLQEAQPWRPCTPRTPADRPGPAVERRPAAPFSTASRSSLPCAPRPHLGTVQEPPQPGSCVDSSQDVLNLPNGLSLACVFRRSWSRLGPLENSQLEAADRGRVGSAGQHLDGGAGATLSRGCGRVRGW